ncbi:uncharacterized protein LOC144175148 isoform X1 [Haemaphysalis longicornis]
MGTESLAEVGTILRSILTSEKNGIPLRKLDGEYRMLTGNRIPYRQFGFNTMEEYLESIPDTVRLARGYDGEVLVHVVVTESTAHVAQMVRGQKSTKPKPMRTTYRRPVMHHQSGYRPNRILTKYSSTYKTPPSASDERRRPGYQIYHPPAQRAAASQGPPHPTYSAPQQQQQHGSSSSAFGWPKKGPALRSSVGAAKVERKPPASGSFSSFAGGFQRSSSFEKPPRFLKPSQRSSSSSSISSGGLSNEEPPPGARMQPQQQQEPVPRPPAPVPPVENSSTTGWRQLDSSWSRSAPAAAPAGAGRTTRGDTGGGGGDATAAADGWGAAASKKPAAAETGTITAAGDTGWHDDRLATDGWGDPAQPVATSTAAKSLLGWNGPQPAAKPATPVQRKPVAAIEPGQPRVDPFRPPGGHRMPWMEPPATTTTSQPAVDPAPVKLAGIEPGQQRCDPFASIAPAPRPANATTLAALMEQLLPTNSNKLALSAAKEKPLEEPPERFDPFRSGLWTEHIPPEPTKAEAPKPQLGLNLASARAAAAPQSPVLASPTTPVAAPALQATATTFVPQFFPARVKEERPEPVDPSDKPTIQEYPLVAPTTPNCLLVLAYARCRGLEPLYSTKPHRSKRRPDAPPMWLCTLRLGDHKFPSYPNDRPTPEEAHEAAAARAVADLRIQATPPARPVTPASTPDEISILVARIVQLVQSKPNGILKEGMGAAYEEKFEERLPPYWLEHVAKSELLHIESARSLPVCSGRQCILYPPQPENGIPSRRHRAVSSDKEDRTDKNSSMSNSSGEPSQESAIDYVDVFVSSVKNTKNVAFRFVEYDAEYQEMLQKMALRYGSGDSNAADVAMELKEGHWYATLYDQIWLRVELTKRLENGKAEVYFVDEGNTWTLDETALLDLEEEFAALPMQAIQCQLDGLAKHADSEGATQILGDLLLGKSLVAEVISREDPITVVMFDTWGSEDVDLNSEIFQRLTTARLPPKGCVGKAQLSHVGHDGVLWLQTNEPGLREVEDFLEGLNQYCQSNPAMVEEPVMDRMYACQFRDDDKFYRAVLLSPDPLPSGEFEVLFVDYGNEAQVFLTEFRNIDCLGDLVVRLPRQAVKCRLRGATEANGITWTAKVSNKLLDLVGEKAELLVRQASEPASQLEPPLVELFKRHEQTRELVSVNDTLVELLTSKPPHTPPPVLPCC